MKKKYTITLLVIVVFVLGLLLALFVIKNRATDTPSEAVIVTESSTNKTNTTTEGTDTFNKSLYSLTDPTSIWVIVNKQNGIPISYVPSLTVPDVKLRLGSAEQQMQISTAITPAVKEMFVAAQKDGITLVFGSGYRSAALQRQFYESYKAKDGQQAADTYSARPGYSEHQTGLAFDLTSQGGTCHLQICWEDTPEGKWVAANAYKYGFILRYQKGKEAITGYQYEPWHFRYVGKELASEIKKSGQTLEEFFNYPAAPNYD